MHYMRLQEKYFNLVANGIKTIELRLRDEKRRLICEGDIIEFSQNNNPTKKCLKKVKALYAAQDFKQLCEKIDIAKTGFQTPAELVDVLHQFYLGEEQMKYGVLAIELEEIPAKN